MHRASIADFIEIVEPPKYLAKFSSDEAVHSGTIGVCQHVRWNQLKSVRHEITMRSRDREPDGR